MCKYRSLPLVVLLFTLFACTQFRVNSNVEINDKMDVKVLGIEGCEATAKTIDLVRSVAKSMGLEIDLVHVTISTGKQAEGERFIGSPTVKINGLDIEPGARDAKSFGVT